MADDALRTQVVRALARDRLQRRLLAPSESLNGLTAGAVHADLGPDSPAGHIIDPLRGARFSSPISSIAGGFRRSIKPDILVAAGRQHYVLNPIACSNGPAVLQVSETTRLGQRVAAPGGAGLPPSHSTRVCGTSNAAALSTRRAALSYEQILTLRNEPGGEALTDDFVAVLLKCLLVHGASWNDWRSFTAAALGESDNRSRNTLRACAQFLGYGEPDWVRASVCTDERVIMLGCGQLGAEQAHVFRAPLPAALSAQRVRRRLTVTLAWLTPINTRNRSYRVADVWFDLSLPFIPSSLIQKDLRVSRLAGRSVTMPPHTTRTEAT
jgi:hypothetical protein